jgi:hypothetical protein
LSFFLEKTAKVFPVYINTKENISLERDSKIYVTKKSQNDLPFGTNGVLYFF